MTCFYHASRPNEQIRRRLSTTFHGEFYWASDPDEMTAVIRSGKRPCLGFKILTVGAARQPPRRKPPSSMPSGASSQQTA